MPLKIDHVVRNKTICTLRPNLRHRAAAGRGTPMRLLHPRHHLVIHFLASISHAGRCHWSESKLVGCVDYFGTRASNVEVVCPQVFLLLQIEFYFQLARVALVVVADYR
jgi:hypothetical protein